jgi:hypothetical protein
MARQYKAAILKPVKRANFNLRHMRSENHGDGVAWPWHVRVAGVASPFRVSTDGAAAAAAQRDQTIHQSASIAGTGERVLPVRRSWRAGWGTALRGTGDRSIDRPGNHAWRCRLAQAAVPELSPALWTLVVPEPDDTSKMHARLNYMASLGSTAEVPKT